MAPSGRVSNAAIPAGVFYVYAPTMETITVRHFGKKHIHIHNDLGNAAFYYRNLIKDRFDRDDRKGITFDLMSCLVFLAFSFEATLNFYGDVLIPRWKEMQSFDSKVQEVFAAIKIKPDMKQSPFSSISQLKKFRDLVAHGKPINYPYDEIIELPKDELERPHNLSGEWEAYCTPDSVFAIYSDIDAILKILSEQSGISPYEMLTRDEGGLSLV